MRCEVLLGVTDAAKLLKSLGKLKRDAGVPGAVDSAGYLRFY